MTRPNVLLISADHWPGSLLRCAGHPAVLTPTLDQLAANGVRFPNAYSECPICVPARRTLLTGLTPHAHGMLTNASLPMPDVPTLAQTFRDAAYQAMAVGKMHVQPQRQRLGFDDIILDEEGRGAEGCHADDYELFLGDHGYAGQRFAGGMCNNEYLWRAWHLEERVHVTNWAAQQMCRQIIRRDPLRPCFWYLAFSHPHPPLAPLQAYLDIYRDIEVPDPYVGAWAQGDDESLAVPVQREQQSMRNLCREFTRGEIRAIRRAFYALCTHIDHQLRLVIGTLREEGLLGNTIICFTSDHGDMLGNHRLWAKHVMYEDSACVPMILVGTDEQKRNGRVGHHRVDTRLVGLADVMPTLLDLAGVEIPTHCQGLSMVGAQQRPYVFGVHGAVGTAKSGNPTRMIRDARYKLIYYPAGNTLQLFDMETDRQELHDLARDPAHAETVARLSRVLVETLPEDERAAWVTNGKLTGWSDAPRASAQPNTWFSGQRGIQWPSR